MPRGHTGGLTMSMPGRETIVALATAPGAGALSIVRMSGSGTAGLLTMLVGSEARIPAARQATLRRLHDVRGETLDEAIILRYVAPHSYTGEDAADIICHGGWVTAARILETLVASGAAPAEPGEFTRRAVLNGRLDLLQAEAVNDLIRAESSAGAKLALQQLDGGLSKKIETLRIQLLDLEALIAYDVDFPEEDDGPVSRERIANAVNTLSAALENLIATAPGGELIRHGAVVAIVGPPNAGKSSLFNALLGRKRALVTDKPGTTRDALEAVLDAAPVALRLVDTAGLRETEDEVERLGVEVSREFLKSASVVLACGDNQEILAAAVEMARTLANGQVIAVWTKRDLQVPGWTPEGNVVAVSAHNGAGLDTLLQQVSEVLSRETHLPNPDMPRVAHARHREVLERAHAEVLNFRDAWSNQHVPVVVAAVHLREAVRVLEELIGVVDVDEVLGRVFSSFCVGK